MKMDRMRIILFAAVFLLLNGAVASQAASLSTNATLTALSDLGHQAFRANNQPTPSPLSRPNPTPTPEPIVTAVIPPTGGVLTAGDGTTVRFLNGAVPGETVIVYTQREICLGPDGPAGIEIRRAFDLSAVDQLTNAPVAQFNPPVIVAIRHNLGGYSEFRDGLALYYHNGIRWATDGITLVAMDNHVITHTTRHFSNFALMERTHRIPMQSSKTDHSEEGSQESAPWLSGETMSGE